MRPPFLHWYGLWTLIEREVARFMAFYVQSMIGPVITTLLFLAIFSLALGTGQTVWGFDFVVFVAPGLVMMSVLQNAFNSPSSSLVIGKIQGNIVDTLMAPLTALELAFGYAISGVIRGLFIGAACWLALAVFIDIPSHSPLMLLLHLINGSLMMSLLGTITGIWADKFDEQATIANFVVNPLAFLSGTFYSIDRLPELWQKLAHLNPFFFVIDGFRYGALGVSDVNPWLSLAVVGGVNLLLLGWTYYLFDRGYNLKS